MAPFRGFTGGTYQGLALSADAERSINFYPERVESADTDTAWTLLSKPGLALVATLPTSPHQAALEINGRAFLVAGRVLYEILATGSYLTWGSVGATVGDVRMVASQTQILILAGGAGWIFTLASNSLVQIASGWLPGATECAFIDGYFIVLELNSQEFIISALNDGTSWNPLDFGDVEGEAGNVVGMIAEHRLLWLLASNHAEAYYDAGNANFPFARLEGAFMQAGCIAAASVVRIDNTIMWLGADERGAGMVWRANGYTPGRVSNHSVETFLASYPSLTDATAYAYQENGHSFYRLDCPSAPSISGAAGLGATWLYDVASGMWHERGYWDAALGLYRADLARTHCFCFNKHLVGDYRSGNLYEQSMDYFTDAGAFIRRLRSTPDVRLGGAKPTRYNALTLSMDVGVGL